jgi:hypothetical protein
MENNIEKKRFWYSTIENHCLKINSLHIFENNFLVWKLDKLYIKKKLIPILIFLMKKKILKN